MRTIFFRGKTICFDSWVYGQFVHALGDNAWGIPPAPCITNIDAQGNGYVIPVDSTTVGEYIGMKDDNGREIYEGDIVQLVQNDMDSLQSYVVVAYYEEHACWSYKLSPDDKEPRGFLLSAQKAIRERRTSLDCFRVVGNVHDNPSLIDDWRKRLDAHFQEMRKAKK